MLLLSEKDVFAKTGSGHIGDAETRDAFFFPQAMIFVTADYVPKLCGSIRRLAKVKCHSEKTNVFHFGTILWELLTRRSAAVSFSSSLLLFSSLLFSSLLFCSSGRRRRRRRLRPSSHNTTQHNTTQHNTTQHNTTQHNTTQHSTTQHNTRQDKTTQHNTTHSDVCATASHASAIRSLFLPGQDGLLGAYKQAEALARRKHKWPTGEDYLGSTAAAAAAANGVPGGAADYSLTTDGGAGAAAAAAGGLAGRGGGSWLVIRDRCAERNGNGKRFRRVFFSTIVNSFQRKGCVRRARSSHRFSSPSRLTAKQGSTHTCGR
eukprot:COSAG06_NODE_1066_length_10841_cov_14.808806_5_plen_318_part_00